MNPKICVALVVLALGLGIYVGKSQYSKTETVEVEKEVIKRDVVTVVKEVVRPDGTKETETTTIDKSKEKKDTLTSVATGTIKPDWHISISASAASVAEISSPAYGFQIERRILGPFSAGLRIQTDKQIGLVVGYEF